MMRQSKPYLHQNKQHFLTVEFLEDRRLLSAANLLAVFLPTPPAVLSSATSGLEATLPFIVSGGSSVRLVGQSSLGDGGNLALAVDTTIRPGEAGLALDAEPDLLSGGGASLHGEVGAWIGLGNDDGLRPEVDIALNLGADAGANLGNEDGVGLPLVVSAGVDEDGVGLGGADLNLHGDAGLGGSGGIVASGGASGSPQDGSKRQGPAVEAQNFGLLDFARATGGEPGDAQARGNEHSLDVELLERASLLLLTDLIGDLETEGLGDEPFGVDRLQAPAALGFQVSGGEMVVTPLEEADLPPEEAGLLSDCAPFNASSLEQLVEQFLAWLDDLAEELAGFWAGLGIPFWVLLTLAAAATAGEVARRNLGRWQRRLLDATFASAPGE